MKIVKFDDGTYGIKKGWWIFSMFLDCHDPMWWMAPQNVRRWSRFSTLQQAQKRLLEVSPLKYKDIK